MDTAAPLPSSLPRLSPRQRELFLFVARYLRENHFAPSVGEMCAALGLSVTTTFAHLGRVVEKGVLGRKDGVPRAMWITPLGEELAATLDATPADASACSSSPSATT